MIKLKKTDLSKIQIIFQKEINKFLELKKYVLWKIQIISQEMNNGIRYHIE